MTDSEASDGDSRGRLHRALASVWNSLREFHAGYSDVGSIHAARDAKRRQESAAAEHGEREKNAPADEAQTDETQAGETQTDETQHTGGNGEHSSNRSDRQQ